MVWQCCSSQHHASVLFLSASVSEASVNIINLFVGQGNSNVRCWYHILPFYHILHSYVLTTLLLWLEFHYRMLGFLEKVLTDFALHGLPW